MNTIGTRIKYLPASNDPLSADVYLIDGDKYCYIYDVGNNNHSQHHINQIQKEKIVILSHYHQDHTGNIESIHYYNLYTGRKTQETIGKGIIVEESFTIHDGVKIDVIPCTSPHTDGSLIITVDNEYTLIADLFFTRPPFNKEKAEKMIASLSSINTKYFVISHWEEGKLVLKDNLVNELSELFNPK